MTSTAFVKRLEEVIKAIAGGNQTDFAARIGAPRANVNAWLNKGRLPAEEYLAAMRGKLNVDINWLFTGKGSMFLGEQPQTAEVKEKPAVYKKRSEEKPARPSSTKPYYTKKQQQFLQKLINIMRHKEEGTVRLLLHSIDIAYKGVNKEAGMRNPREEYQGPDVVCLTCRKPFGGRPTDCRCDDPKVPEVQVKK